jgi:hypothetical protein
VQPLNKKFHLSDGKRTGVTLKILGKNRKPLYLLQCFLNAYDRKDKDFNYTGDFECRLTSLFDDYYAHRTLLTEETPQLRDWASRGVFHINELECKRVEGVCIKYPGYGRTRRFKLRGMDLIIEIDDFKMQDSSHGKKGVSRERMKELDFTVIVKRDPKAVSNTAEPLRYDDPLYREIIWPPITPFRKVVHFEGHQRTQVEICGKDGAPLYVLLCYLNPSDVDSDSDKFDYSGDFECRLISLYDNRQSTLLTENLYPTRDWQSRGRFLIAEITGKCADYPDYGRVRNFKLRGMSLTLALSDLKIIADSTNSGNKLRDYLKELNLEINVVADSSAVSEIAEPSRYRDPVFRNPKNPNELTRDCSKILMR